MMQRMDMLLSLGYACVELSQQPKVSREKLGLISLGGEIVPFKNSKTFSELCVYFFNPLISQIHKWYTDLS